MGLLGEALSGIKEGLKDTKIDVASLIDNLIITPKEKLQAQIAKEQAQAAAAAAAAEAEKSKRTQMMVGVVIVLAIVAVAALLIVKFVK